MPLHFGAGISTVKMATKFECFPSIDTTTTMCVHGKLDLFKIQDVKAVNIEVAEQFFQVAQNDLEQTKRMNHESLCEICVRNHCRNIKLSRSMIKDHKIINDGLKQPVSETANNEDDKNGYWVGKNTLKKWRGYAREALEKTVKEEKIQYVEDQQPKLSLDEVQAKLAKIGTDVIISHNLIQNGGGNVMTNGHHSSGPSEFFNSDIICPHGNLCIQEGKRKLVSVDVWLILSGYFGEPKTFPKSSPLCPSCITNDDKARLAIG